MLRKLHDRDFNGPTLGTCFSCFTALTAALTHHAAECLSLKWGKLLQCGYPTLNGKTE